MWIDIKWNKSCLFIKSNKECAAPCIFLQQIGKPKLGPLGRCLSHRRFHYLRSLTKLTQMLLNFSFQEIGYEISLLTFKTLQSSKNYSINKLSYFGFDFQTLLLKSRSTTRLNINSLSTNNEHEQDHMTHFLTTCAQRGGAFMMLCYGIGKLLPTQQSSFSFQ